MPIIHAIVLGLVQGLSEFLPISSSGHLIFVPWLFGWNDFDSDSVQKAFDVALHIGTLAAVCIYFRRDLLIYIRDGWRALRSRGRRATPEGRLAWLLLLATLPAAAVGAVFEKQIDEQLGRIPLIAVSLIVFGLLLGWADRLPGKREIESMDGRDALIIGAAQVLSLNPGTSRSGITITAGRMQTFTRETAARISFLMAIPVTAGAALFKVGKLVKDGIPDGLAVPMIVGILTSGVAGWVAVAGLLRYVRTHSFTPFVIYRVVLGVVLLIVAVTGLR
jgi:undecaprenyl-diphosphatase